MMLTEKILSLPLPFWLLSLPLSYTFLHQDDYLSSFSGFFSTFFFFPFFLLLSVCILLNYQGLICHVSAAVWSGSFSPTDMVPLLYSRLTMTLLIIWGQTTSCFLMLMHSLESTVEDYCAFCFTIPFHIIFCHIKREQDRFELINTISNDTS